MRRDEAQYDVRESGLHGGQGGLASVDATSLHVYLSSSLPLLMSITTSITCLSLLVSTLSSHVSLIMHVSLLMCLRLFSSFLAFLCFLSLFLACQLFNDDDNEHSSGWLSLYTRLRLAQGQSACTLAHSLSGEHVHIMQETINCLSISCAALMPFGTMWASLEDGILASARSGTIRPMNCALTRFSFGVRPSDT